MVVYEGLGKRRFHQASKRIDGMNFYTMTIVEGKNEARRVAKILRTNDNYVRVIHAGPGIHHVYLRSKV